MGRVSKNIQTEYKLSCHEVLDLLSKISNRKNSIKPHKLRRCNSDGFYYNIIGTIRENNIRYYIIKFDSGYIKKVPLSMINDGKIKDYLSPTVCNIGFLGLYFHNIFNNDYKLAKSLRSRWKNMLERCYNKNNKKYNIYGGLGIHVCSRWHNFSNYFYDVINLENFDRDAVINNELFLDKDKLQQNVKNKVYSKDTCCWLNINEQNSLIDDTNRISAVKNSLRKKFIIKYSNGNEKIFYGINKYSKENNINYSKIQKALASGGKIINNVYIKNAIN